MHALVDIKKYREDKNGTDLMISVPDMQLGDMLRKKRIFFSLNPCYEPTTAPPRGAPIGKAVRAFQ